VKLVLKDSTETIETYPPILAQAMGSPTARIGTPAAGIPDAGSSATADSVSTALTADASEGATSVTVTSATFVRGRRYLLTATTGEVIPATCAKSVTGTTLFLAEPLPMPLLTGSTVLGWRISIALTSAQTASIGRCVAQWTATLGGVSETWADDFEVVERDGGYHLTADILQSSSPYCVRLRPDSDVDFSETIDAGWRLFMRPALLAKGLRPSQFVSREELDAAHVAACELYLAKQYDSDAQRREEKRRDFSEVLTLVLNSETLWVTEAENDGLTPPDPDAPRPWTFTQVTR
jgi:hypothetical protein